MRKSPKFSPEVVEVTVGPQVEPHLTRSVGAPAGNGVDTLIALRRLLTATCLVIGSARSPGAASNPSRSG